MRASLEKNNLPKKHHYIPVFYLKRWIGSDGRLCQFSKPNGAVIPNRKYPSQTGFEDRLYTIKGVSDSVAQQMEELFLKPVDARASEALRLMEKDGNKAHWNSELRSAWTKFLHSLLLRCPEDVQSFLDIWNHHYISDATGEWEIKYQKVRRAIDPATYQEYMLRIPRENIDANGMKTLANLIDSEVSGTKINNMLWYILDTKNAGIEFLTSDRPIVRTNGLMRQNGHLVLAIGPRRLFIAARNEETLNSILRVSQKKLIKEYNTQVVKCAFRFSYGTSDNQLHFVKKHMSTDYQPRLVDAFTKNQDTISNAIRTKS